MRNYANYKPANQISINGIIFRQPITSWSLKSGEDSRDQEHYYERRFADVVLPNFLGQHQWVNMASLFNKQRNYKYMAEKYSQLNKMQVNYGKKLVRVLDLKHGGKVLDMGCGTGEITSFIADQVGEEGEIFGVDPDQERIKVAAKLNSSASGAKRNIKFVVGDSSSHFPHYNEEFYDVHFSNFVFHWLTDQEKDVFLKTAFNCLKPGGRIVMLYEDESPEVMIKVLDLLTDDEIEKNTPPLHYIEKSVVQSKVEKSGFAVLFSEYAQEDMVFPSLESFLTWFCACSYVDERKLVPHKKEEFSKKFVNEDGTVCFKMKLFRIIAKK